MMTAKMGEKDSREEILKAFRLFDDDETGKITFRNLKRVAKELGENMTDEELQEMIDEADRDGTCASVYVPCVCVCVFVSVRASTQTNTLTLRRQRT